MAFLNVDRREISHVYMSASLPLNGVEAHHPQLQHTMPVSAFDAALLLAAFAQGAWATSKTHKGAIVLPLTYNEITAAYYAPFEVGTPPQTEYLKVDTGSPTISFLDSQSSFCEQSNHPCKTYGSFDNETSS
jgi:hypothetical protein